MKKIICYISVLILAFAAFADSRKVLQIFQGGVMTHSIDVDKIDYMEVREVFDIPQDVSAVYADGVVQVSWVGVDDAVYNVYRSADGVTYSPIARDLTGERYRDESPLQGANYYKIEAVVDGVSRGLSEASPEVSISSSGTSDGLYLGIIGFNYDLYKYPVALLDADSRQKACGFIDALTIDRQTLLYYSVDQAITTLKSTPLPDNLINVALVTFTDGLDMGSLMIDGLPYDEDEQYSAAINARIKNETVGGLPVTAYSIGVKGNDVKDINKFRSNLQMLASSSENAFEVSSMAEVKSKFQEIASQLTKTNYVQTLAIKIQGVSNGALVRFTLDNVADAKYSDCYIEGSFNLRERALENVTYHGLKSSTGSSVAGVIDDRRELTFTFEGLQTDNNQSVMPDFIDEWTYINSTGQWQINSEFVKNQDTEVETEMRSAAVMLVLDCSSSLGSDFSIVQANAKAFIEALCPDGESGATDPAGLYSTTPIDMSLAVCINGKRYYLTQEQYAKANLNDAVKEGVTVVQGDEKFIISLEDVPTDGVRSAYATEMYGRVMPSYYQGQIVCARYSAINSAMESFGGKPLGEKWVNDSRNGACWSATNDFKYYSDIVSLGVRPVVSVSTPAPIIWTPENDLKLAVEKDGRREYITKEQYDAMGESLGGYKVLGLAVMCDSESFIVSLKDAPTDAVAWTLADSLYGDVLPTNAQGTVIGARLSVVDAAIVAFGGEAIGGQRWTRENGWYFQQNTGGALSAYNSHVQLKVRPVYSM